MRKKKISTRRALRARYKLQTVSRGRPRLSVHKSGRYVYAQIIDDAVSQTLAAASSLEAAIRKTKNSALNVETAGSVGRLVAERAIAVGVKSVVFDRGAYPYHGRVKALADAARAAGLDF